MIFEIAFWDASALTPLFVDQPTTAQASSLSRSFDIAAWWGTAVEIHSAIARLHRLDQLNSDAQQEAIHLLRSVSSAWLEIKPDTAIRNQAQALLHKHPLRAADSLQLAAALAWCRDKPFGRTFLCSDIKLCEAAEREGFVVIQP